MIEFQFLGKILTVLLWYDEGERLWRRWRRHIVALLNPQIVFSLHRILVLQQSQLLLMQSVFNQENLRHIDS